MTVGTLVVTAILVVIVAAIIISMVRSHRAGKHVGCDGCGACGVSQGGHENAQRGDHHAHHHGAGACGCASVESMIARMNKDLDEADSKY